jgi:RimJ/RimL family protein N-acetyltransferase
VTLPHLETRRLVLRPRREADLDDCLAMDRDPEVVRFVPGPWRDPVRHRAFVLDRMRRIWPDGLGYWVLAPKAMAHGFLGWVLLIPDDGVGPEVEIGWRLPRRQWGQGFASEAAARILRHGFETVGLDHVVAAIHAANHASRRVATRIGMRPEGPHPPALVRYVARPPSA